MYRLWLQTIAPPLAQPEAGVVMGGLEQWLCALLWAFERLAAVGA